MPNLPPVQSNTTKWFTEGGNGVPPSWPGSTWFNIIQSEILNVLAAADIPPDKENLSQLSEAIQYLITLGVPDLKDASLTQKGIVQLSNATNSTSEIFAATPKAVRAVDVAALKIANNLSEITTAGPVAVAATLLNLGLGDAAKKGIATNAEMQVGTADKLVSLIGLMSIFGKRDFTENDYIRIPDVPGGLIIQWCLVTNLLPNVAAVSPWSWTLPIPFPNKILGGTVATAGTATPLSSSANLSGIPRTNGPIPNITGSVQNTRTDQSVSIYCIVIGR
ncbi:TPA: tail fiber protein [Yersinia enterocolitica]|nr:tail fiber protein [Yersinia enterocolitica]